MNLYVMRHADAVPLGRGILRDADRYLSERGEEDAALVARSLLQIDSHITMVITSPLVRAVRTGEIIATVAGTRPVLHTTEHLAPGFRSKALIEEVVALTGGGNAVVIGHQPDLTMFVSFLISDSRDSGIAFETASIACVQLKFDGKVAHGSLRWLLTPDILKSVHLSL